jgi:hypothetical protein
MPDAAELSLDPGKPITEQVEVRPSETPLVEAIADADKAMKDDLTGLLDVITTTAPIDAVLDLLLGTPGEDAVIEAQGVIEAWATNDVAAEFQTRADRAYEYGATVGERILNL